MLAMHMYMAFELTNFESRNDPSFEKELQIKTRDWAKVSLEGAEAKAECLIS